MESLQEALFGGPGWVTQEPGEATERSHGACFGGDALFHLFREPEVTQALTCGAGTEVAPQGGAACGSTKAYMALGTARLYLRKEVTLCRFPFPSPGRTCGAKGEMTVEFSTFVLHQAMVDGRSGA